jgi:dolichyl-phosphate-mannose-protein mannosyltransferase
MPSRVLRCLILMGLAGKVWRHATSWTGGVPVALFVAHLCLTLPNIEVPDRYVGDEVYQVLTARRYAVGDHAAFVWYAEPPLGWGGTRYEWIHPPVAKLILAGSIPAAIAGALIVSVTFLLGRRLLHDKAAAALAGLSLLAEGTLLTLSRTGVAEVFVALFILLAFHALARWAAAPAERAPTFIGVWLGLAIATKWSGVLALLIIAGLMACEIARRPPHVAPDGRRARIGECLTALTVVPAAIYLGSYLPFFWSGHSFAELGELVRRQISFHLGLRAHHWAATPWWSWPLALHPMLLWSESGPGGRRDVLYLGNIVIWWTGLVAMVIVAARALTQARRARGAWSLAPAIIVLGFLGQWLPWALPQRPSFSYYLLPALPFLALATASLFCNAGRFGDGQNEPVRAPRLASRRSSSALALARTYLATALLVAIVLYPLWTGRQLSGAERSRRLFLPWWTPIAEPFDQSVGR